MKKIYFVTTNKLKLAIAKKALTKHGIEIENLDIDTPELQAFSSKEIVENSIMFAFSKIAKPVVKTDVEYRITSLGGFPGPYAKYINKWLTAGDILNMMQGKIDRSMLIVEYLAYYDGENLKTFSTSFPCQISEKIEDDTKGSTFDKITLREGFSKPQNQLTKNELETLLCNQITLWDDLADYLATRFE